jgi:hypothetical protein
VQKAPIVMTALKFLSLIFQYLKITRHLKRSLLKEAIHLLFIYTFIAIGVADCATIWDGTYFFVQTDGDFATVSIDSRRGIRNDVTGAITPDDEYCKITILDDYTIFFGAGLSYIANEFDAFNLAIDKSKHQRSPIDLRKLATEWATEGTRRIQHAYPTDADAIDALRPDGIMFDGVFVGHTKDGAVSVINAIIKKNSDNSFDYTVAAIPTLSVTGYFEIFSEFFPTVSSDRAQALASSNPALQTSSSVEYQAARNAMIVAAVRDWSQDPLIGGDIATIILERGQKWRCYHRPDFCPEKKTD